MEWIAERKCRASFLPKNRAPNLCSFLKFMVTTKKCSPKGLSNRVFLPVYKQERFFSNKIQEVIF